MTLRERFVSALAFERLDRAVHTEWGFWDDTLSRWRTEGLPDDVVDPSFSYVTAGHDVFQHFGIAKFGYILPGQYYRPPFPYELVDEDDHYRVERTENGVLQRVNKMNPTIPEFIDYPVKNRRDYEAIRDRLAPDAAGRYPDDWTELVEIARTQDHTPMCTHMDGFFASPREMMGLTGFLTTLYDDPGLIREMVNDRAEFYIAVYERALREMQPDFAFVWEDMCFKNGPLLSPAMFREFLLPAYRKLISFLRDMGVVHVVVDSDGDVLELIPLWIEAGVTALLPFEVRAGMDVVEIGELFPDLVILGGIDKHRIAEGRASIDDELDRVLPAMLARGGYLAGLDHWVPPQISCDDFRYYVERLQSYRAP